MWECERDGVIGTKRKVGMWEWVWNEVGTNVQNVWKLDSSGKFLTLEPPQNMEIYPPLVSIIPIDATKKWIQKSAIFNPDFY